MNNLTKRDKVLLVILLVLVVSFLYLRFLITPSIEKISNVKADIETNKGKLDTLDNKKIQNQAIRNKLKNLIGKYEDAKLAIPTGVKDAEIVTSISKICSKDNIQLSSLSFSNGVIYSNSNNNTAASSSKTNAQAASGQLMSTEASISITGNLTNIISFIDDFEHTDRIGIISTVSFSQSDNSFKASITANYFYFQGLDTKSNTNNSKSIK